MARLHNGVWDRASKDTWYILIDGVNKPLKVKGEKNKKQAITAWHGLMKHPTTPKPIKVRTKPPTVQSLIDAFLTDAKTRVKENTYKNYEAILSALADQIGSTKVDTITAAKVQSYANRKEWGKSYRHTVLGTIKTMCKWAEENEIITVSPVKKMMLPSMTSRGSKAAISPDTHQRLLQHASPCFRLFLTMLHETGARPSELSRITAQDLDITSGLVILNEHKTSEKTGKPHLIILTDSAMDILKSQSLTNPVGPLLLNGQGNHWTKNGIGFAMRKACKKAGVKAIAYGYRHAFATDALFKGVPDATVAALLGHSGTAMLHKHYSHLTSRTQTLWDAISLVR